MKLIECVPNFSEGRDPGVIDAIAAAIAAIPDVTLLDVDPGADTNRTVVTFVGAPDAVVEAAFAAIATAADRIDMRSHRGAHARMGATDVCPLVPVSGVTMEECVELACRLGRRVGEELGIPVYLYERAARTPRRRNLAEVRAGEYEGLAAKLADPDWHPDFGPATFHARAGATVIGAREFLIAYNINLNTRSKKLAHDIALELREKGRFKRDGDGRIVRDATGNKVSVPGLFKEVKAVGWTIDAFSCAQISINFTSYRVSPPHLVFDQACELATARGLRVTGSELVGLVPRDAMLEAGRHYLRRQGAFCGVPDAELVRVAVQSMGLAELGPFDPREKIIEYRIGEGDGRLIAMSGRGFCEELASAAPAPGGGSVAALAAAHSAALGAMVAALTHGKKGYEGAAEEMNALGVEAHALKERLLSAVDADAVSFDAVMAASRMPRKSPEESVARETALEAANQHATRIPLATLRACIRPLEIAEAVATRGNQNSLSDAGVAALMARAAAEGAHYNVLINLAAVTDSTFRTEVRAQAEADLAQAVELAERIRELVVAKLTSAIE